MLTVVYRAWGGGRERSWYATPYSNGPAALLEDILYNTTSLEAVSFNNDDEQLHNGALESFSAWAAELLDAPVAVYEVSGEVSGRWPGNPNVVADWHSSKIVLDTDTLAVRYTAVESYSFFYSTSKPVFDSNPAQRVVMLYAVPRTTKRAAPFPIEIPPPNAAYPLIFETASSLYEPSYGVAVQTLLKPALQYSFVGQWVQRFPLSQPYGMIQGKTDNQGVWIDVLPPFDGLGETTFYGFRVYNDSAGDIEMRFGPGALPFGEAIAAGSYGKYGAIGGVDAHDAFTVTPTNRLQLRAADDNAPYRIEFWLAPRGKGGCGCGG